ncbi:hypothetical protein SAMN04487906_3104 [Zhouia amylolytica]|uniref:Uncharacterized protein n=1 Tax=Zhouia amylolytica TaxID=376730 RepID=A0A1I6VGC5_9FLAO|nr:hypothetical protein [Zhouia amylolytica]SFT12710.1 hypothetical protein SAMN04487906_3104 [Zhouia amylolytica]
MKINNLIYILLIGCLGLFALQSCESDPVFPDPGFELEDTRVEIRRDTADFYDINLKMDVPNGVSSINILDATNYEVLEKIDEYNGRTKFDFQYRVDLTSFEKDTVLNYLVKVTDADDRSFNRGIRIDVKGFSFPEIKLVGGDNISVAAPAYVVKGLITTGLNAISSVQVLFEGEEQYLFESNPSEPLYEMPLKQLVFLGNLELDVEYHIDVVIVDEKGQTSTTTIKVFKGESVQRPVQINYLTTSDLLIQIKFQYDENGNMTALDYIFPNGRNYYHEFRYNDLKMVDTLLYRSTEVDGSFTFENYRYINYIPGSTEIQNIESQSFEYEEGNVVIGDVEVEADNFVYDPVKGTVLSFNTNSTVDNIYYSDPFNLGENIFGEFWQSTSYMSSNTIRRQHREDYDPVLMPTFNEGLPPFVSGNSALFEVFNDLFWHKYIMTKTVPTDPSYSGTYLREPSYTYETDNNGNITRIVKLYTSGTSFVKGKSASYSFFYE